MNVIKQTDNYYIVLNPNQEGKEGPTNYDVISKEHQVVESQHRSFPEALGQVETFEHYLKILEEGDQADLFGSSLGGTIQ